MNSIEPFRPITPGVTIGHVHLKVADLERALAFYSGVLGFLWHFHEGIRRIAVENLMLDFTLS